MGFEELTELILLPSITAIKQFLENNIESKCTNKPNIYLKNFLFFDKVYFEKNIAFLLGNDIDVVLNNQRDKSVPEIDKNLFLVFFKYKLRSFIFEKPDIYYHVLVAKIDKEIVINIRLENDISYGF